MKYHLTIERTYRIGIEFEAPNAEEAEAEEAEAKAAEFANTVGDEIFSGDCESDYALCDEEDHTILDWD